MCAQQALSIRLLKELTQRHQPSFLYRWCTAGYVSEDKRCLSHPEALYQCWQHIGIVHSLKRNDDFPHGHTFAPSAWYTSGFSLMSWGSKVFSRSRGMFSSIPLSSHNSLLDEVCGFIYSTRQRLHPLPDHSPGEPYPTYPTAIEAFLVGDKRNLQPWRPFILAFFRRWSTIRA